MTKFERSIQRLNDAQRQAVETIYGPIMVVAGPGTGKTQMLALRIANLLQSDSGADPSNILCLTFTEAGVKAMRERLTSFIGNAAYKVAIHTFHSFANEIIQTNPERFSFSKELKQLDDLERLKIMQSLIDQLVEEEEGLDKLVPFYNKYHNIPMITSAIQTLKKEAINAEKLKKRVKEIKESHEANPEMWRGKPKASWKKKLEKIEKLEELQIFYEQYQNRLKEEGLYDYEDMIMFVIEEFKENQPFLQDYQERYQFIHVDEYQDTNGAQNEIVRLLGSGDPDNQPNIFVVGDDDQAIYRFQGANLGNILFFAKHFDQVKIIPTTINYRSTQVILDLADSLITNNQTRLVEEYEDLVKILKQGSDLSDQPKAEVWEFTNGDEEHLFISNEIKKLHESGVDYDEIAVIFRRNVQGDELARNLLKTEIPIKTDVSKNLFESEVVQKLVHMLKVIKLYDKTINEDLYRMMLFDFFQIPVVDVYELNDNARSNKTNLIKSLIGLEDTEENSQLINFANNLLKWHKDSQNTKLSRFIEILLNESGLINYLTETKDENTDNVTAEESKDFEDILAINSFFSYVSIQEQLHSNLTLNQFLNDLGIVAENKLKVSLPKVDTEKDSVNLITAHSSKGLEFKYVFIMQATDKNWGSTRKSPSLLIPELYSEEDLGIDEKELMLEDERRLFFVALTRAKQKVYISHAKEYVSDGNASSASPSQFILEMNQDLLSYKNVDRDDIEFSKEDFVSLLKTENKEILGDREQAYLKEKIKNFKLSPSALNTYLKSPKQFKENYLLRVPQAKSKELALGTAIHFALESLNKTLMNNEEVLYQSLETMQENFVRKLTDEFASDEEFERTKEEGLNILESYYENYVKTGKYQKPLEVEYNFGFHNVILPLSDQEPIYLTGKIDKVEIIDQDQNLVRIIDYKTSKPQSENHIRGNTKASDGSYWRQLVFYKLMVDLDDNFRPGRKMNNSKYQFGEAQIDFLREERNKFVKRSFAITQNDVDELKELINEVMKRIRNLKFPEEY